MLLLARCIHEEIVVIDNETGEQIVVTPTGYRGNQVKIGKEASKTRFTILRGKVLERGKPTPPRLTSVDHPTAVTVPGFSCALVVAIAA